MVHLVALASSSASLGIVPPSTIIDALDNSIRDELQRNAQHFFFWVLVSAFVVAMGVVLEGPEILHELWPRLFLWLTWESTERLHRFERVIKKIAFVGWLLIGIGVFGEGTFEALQNRAEGQLQTFNFILLKDARLTASTAKESAFSAAAAASDAEASAEDAERKSGNAVSTSTKASGIAEAAKGEAGAVGIKAAKFDQQLSTADTQLKALDARRKELEEALTPRVIPYRQYCDGSTNIDDLKALGSVNVILQSAPDGESIRAANDLSFLFQQAGWKVESMTLDPSILFFGVHTLTYEHDPNNFTSLQGIARDMELSKRGNEIRDTFEEWLRLNGWSTQMDIPVNPDHTRVDVPAETLRVRIGYKPDSYFDSQWEKDLIKKVTEEQRTLAPNANPSKKIKTWLVMLAGETSGEINDLPCP